MTYVNEIKSLSVQQAATYLCPAVFPWVDMGPATEESGMVVLKLVGVFYSLIIVFDVLLVFVSSESSTFVYVLLYTLLFAVIVIIGAISRKPQNKWVSVTSYHNRTRFVFMRISLGGRGVRIIIRVAHFAVVIFLRKSRSVFLHGLFSSMAYFFT